MTENTDAVARTKADPNRSMREDALVAEIERLRRALSKIEDGVGSPYVVAYLALQGVEKPNVGEGAA
jgi:hypothetical protein